MSEGGNERLSRRDAFMHDKDSTVEQPEPRRADLFNLIIGQRDEPLDPDHYPELKKNPRTDLYSICVKKQGEISAPDAQQTFGKYMNLSKINITPKFIFLCYRTKRSAVDCLEGESENYAISIPAYEAQDGRAAADEVCHHCHETGHNKKICPKLTGVPLKCHLCDDSGHKAQDCPTKTDEKPSEDKDGTKVPDRKCHECGDAGHMYTECPRRIKAIQNETSPGGPPTQSSPTQSSPTQSSPTQRDVPDKKIGAGAGQFIYGAGQSGHRGGPCVYVGGIPETMGKADIEEIVKPYGSLQVFFYLRKPTDTRGSCRYAFCYFKTMEQAQKVATTLNEQDKPEFFGKKLQFRIVRDKSRARIIEDGGRDNRRMLPANVQQQNEMMQANVGMGRGAPGYMPYGPAANINMVQVPMAKLQGATDLVYRIGGLMQEVLDDCYFCGRVAGLHKELEHLMVDITQNASGGTVGRGGHGGHSGGHASMYGLGRGAPMLSPGRGGHGGGHQAPGRIPYGRGNMGSPYVETDSGVFGAVDIRYKQQQSSPANSANEFDHADNFTCKYGPSCKRMNDPEHLRRWNHPKVLPRGVSPHRTSAPPASKPRPAVTPINTSAGSPGAPSPGAPRGASECQDDGAGGDIAKPATMGAKLHQLMADVDITT